jgi:hypothetical protein
VTATLEAAHVPADSVRSAAVTLEAKRLVEALRGALLTRGQLLFGFEPLLQDRQEWPKLRARLLSPPVLERLALKAQGSLDRIP